MAIWKLWVDKPCIRKQWGNIFSGMLVCYMPKCLIIFSGDCHSWPKEWIVWLIYFDSCKQKIDENGWYYGGWCSDNAISYYFGGVQFYSCLGQWVLCLLFCLCCSLDLPDRYQGNVLIRLWPLAVLFQYIIHLQSCHQWYVVWCTDIISKNKPQLKKKQLAYVSACVSSTFWPKCEFMQYSLFLEDNSSLRWVHELTGILNWVCVTSGGEITWSKLIALNYHSEEIKC